MESMPDQSAELMKADEGDACCPRFDPKPWDGVEVKWDKKMFIKDRVRSVLHVPLNFGAVMRRNRELIARADAGAKDGILLSDENSLWGADVYIETAKPVPSARMESISGTFFCKVFEGPYRNMRLWIDEMKQAAESRRQTIKKLYFYYTTCPKCAKRYGKNYVVLLAQI